MQVEIQVLSLSVPLYFMGLFLICSCFLFGLVFVFTPPGNRGGLYFHFSLFVCVCVCVCLSVCEQNADRTATPILTRSSLNSCLLQSLKPYIEIGDLGLKVKVTVT